jgi:3'-5' exoribonuclease 1
MRHVFVDFEMTCWGWGERQLEPRMAEIIDFGAVLLNERLEMVDRFSQLVRPEFHPVLTRSCQRLTGISPAMLATAPLFGEVLQAFQVWLGAEAYKVYSWADDDRIQLQRECQAKGLEMLRPVRWHDLQKLFKRVYKFSQRSGLLQAVQMMGFSFEGQQHRAVTDAVNSAKILQVMKDPERHRRFQRSLQTVYNSRQEFAVSIGDLLKGKLK